MTDDAPPAPVVFVHPSADVETGAQVGAGTRIWHLAHVRSTARIGAGCTIGRNVYVDAGVEIGDRVKIQNNVSVYVGVTLEDEVFVGPSAVFTNVVNPRAFVVRKDEYRPTRVKRGASIGANATIVCGVTLGRYCVVGAGGVVTRDVPDYAVVYGNPARVRSWVCWCGVGLAGRRVSEGVLATWDRIRSRSWSSSSWTCGAVAASIPGNGHTRSIRNSTRPAIRC